MDRNRIIKVIMPDIAKELIDSAHEFQVDGHTAVNWENRGEICKVFITDTFTEHELARVGLLNQTNLRKWSNSEKCKRFKDTTLYTIMATTGCTPIIVPEAHVAPAPTRLEDQTNIDHLSSYNFISNIAAWLKLFALHTDTQWNEQVKNLGDNSFTVGGDEIITFELGKFIRSIADLVRSPYYTERIKADKGLGLGILIQMLLTLTYSDWSWANDKTRLLRSSVEQLAHLINLSKTLRNNDINNSQFVEYGAKLNTTLISVREAEIGKSELIHSPCYKIGIPPLTAVTMQDLAYLRKTYGFKADELGYLGLDDLASLCYRKPGISDADYEAQVDRLLDNRRLVVDLVTKPLVSFNRWDWKVDPRVWANNVNQNAAVTPLHMTSLDKANPSFQFIHGSGSFSTPTYEIIGDGTTITNFRRHNETKDSVSSGTEVAVVPGGVHYARGQ